jgi:hypothetical protein
MAAPATGFAEMAFLTFPDTVPVVEPVAPVAPVDPVDPVLPFPHPKKRKAVEMSAKLSRRYLDKLDKG